MKRNLTTFTLMSLLFVVLLICAGSLSGIFSDIIYYLAFILPTVLGVLTDLKLRKQEAAHDREYPEPQGLLGFSREGLKLLAPCIFPTVLAVLALSYLTSLLLGAFTGAENTVDVGNNLWVALISHALVPAVLEEMLFRFMPMRMLARHSGALTVTVSSLYFALVHNSFFSMPYALFAGAVFILLDLMCESVWPSVMLHLINNAVSVLWIFYGDTEAFILSLVISLCVLSAVSAVFIVLMRKKYLGEVKRVWHSGDRMQIGYEPLALIAPTLFIAFTELV